MDTINATNFVPEEKESYKFEVWIGLLSIALACGLLGNLFGLMSIIFAKNKQKYGFHTNWKSSTLFFFHLLVVDLIYCLFLVAKEIHALFIYLKIDKDEVNEKECRFFVLGAQTFANIGGWCMMSIVFTQAIPKIR